MRQYYLGELIQIKHGFAFDGEHIQEEDNGVVLVTPGNFRIGGGFQEEKCKFFSGDYPLEYVLNPGDLIVTMTDLSKTIDTLGYSAIIPASNRTYLHNQRIGLVSLISNSCDKMYLYWLMRTHDYQRSIANTSTGSTVHHTSPTKILEYRFSAPNLDQQKKIAQSLSAYDDLIETNQRQIKLLEEAAQRLYKEWFVDLRFPGHENVPVVDGVPEGWKKQKLLVESSVLRRGISPAYSNNGKYTVISQKCIRSAIMDIVESRRQEKDYSPELNLEDGDTVICSTGTGTLGRVGQVFGKYPNTTFDSHVTLVRSKQYPHYHYHAIKSKEEYLMGMGRGSTNQQELYRSVIEDLDVYIPVAEVLRKAEELFDNIHGQITTLKDRNERLSEARDRLLPKLMSGEIAI